MVCATADMPEHILNRGDVAVNSLAKGGAVESLGAKASFEEGLWWIDCALAKCWP